MLGSGTDQSLHRLLEQTQKFAATENDAFLPFPFANVFKIAEDATVKLNNASPLASAMQNQDTITESQLEASKELWADIKEVHKGIAAGHGHAARWAAVKLESQL